MFPFRLFASSDFMPHGYCFLWRPALLWLHVASDTLIVLAYYSIPFALWVLIRNRKDLAYGWILRLFSAFIFLCGTSHLANIWTIWFPDYWLSGFVKALTAAVSVGTAVLVWPLLPKVLALPSPAQLLKVNQELADALEKHKRTEDELRKLSLAIEYSSSMVVITDTAGYIEYCNPAFCKVTGYSRAEVIGNPISILKSGFTTPSAYQDLWNTLTQGKAWEGEFLDRKKNGDLYWAMEYMAPMRDELGLVTHYVAVSHDITDLKNSEETIKRLAFYDPLTELPNRALFKERLEQALYYAKRSGTLFAVMYLDLDRFKYINDTLGHVFGDKLLIAVGRRLSGVLREGDTVARLGGDEFAIILPGLDQPENAGTVAESITRAMNQPFEVAGYNLFVTASIGISLYPLNHVEIEQLIKMADTALYKVKDSGRNNYEYYSDISNAMTVEHLSLETSLRYAVERHELAVHYQPKFELADERLCGLEALLRWRHPTLGPIPPDRFIPIAEETGLISAIGEWVVRDVCRQIKTWEKDGIRLPVAVNLSARQFREKKLLATIDAILAETGVDPAYLEFEITETTVMNNPEQTVNILREMKTRGLKLSIDDFGTGYSSLSHLKRFPVDALKIDRSFVRDIDSDQDDASIVRAVIVLAHSLGLAVIAEGVETREQLAFLREQQCDQVQGFWFGPALPAGELAEKFGGPLRTRSGTGQRSRAMGNRGCGG
jgi:diguanylate cyclase (GGDEF)-like protein/PAS domain S-box-containing protein